MRELGRPRRASARCWSRSPPTWPSPWPSCRGPDQRVELDAGRGGALGRRHAQPGLPAHQSQGVAAAGRPEHPFGYGKAQYFWSLIAAVGIFVAGAVFSVYRGSTPCAGGGESGGVLIAYVVLGVVVPRRGDQLAARRAAAARRGAGRGRHLPAAPPASARTRASRPFSPRTAQPWWACSSRRPVSGCTTSRATPPGTAAPPSRSACCSPTWRSSWAGTCEPPHRRDGRAGARRRRARPAAGPRRGHHGRRAAHDAPRSRAGAGGGPARPDDASRPAQVEEFSGRVDAELREAHSEITQVFLDATRPDPDLARRTAVHVERLRAVAAST